MSENITYLKIGDLDVSNYVTSLKLSYEAVVANEKINARGQRIMDFLADKVNLACSFKSLPRDAMRDLLEAIKSHVVSVTFLDSQPHYTESEEGPPERLSKYYRTIEASVSNPEPEYYWIHSESDILYAPLQLTFTEL